MLLTIMASENFVYNEFLLIQHASNIEPGIFLFIKVYLMCPNN